MRRLLAVVGLCVCISTAFASEVIRPANVALESTPPAAPGACAGIVTKNRAPMYPISDLAYGIGGTVVLAMATDECGKVTSVAIQKSSGHKSLDSAAVAAASHWMFDKDVRAASADGVIIRPVEFKEDDSIAPPPPREPDWPETHRHVRWVLNEAPGDYTSATAAEDSITSQTGASGRTVPYRIPWSSFVQLETATGKEFWYFIDTVGDGSKTMVAARYQPVYDNGEPIVRLSVFCELQADRCAAFKKLFMKGLGYAKPK